MYIISLHNSDTQWFGHKNGVYNWCLPVKEVLHLRTDHGLLGVHGDPQDHCGQHPRHTQVLLTYRHTNKGSDQ